MDVEAILEIPLSHRRQGDFWSWHYERRGMFTVRSAYNLLIATRDRREDWLEERAASSNEAGIQKQWSALWSTPVPPKVKIFLWRLAKQSILTNAERLRRHMADTSACQFCGAHDTWRHALIDCTTSRCVWALEEESIIEHMSCSDDGDARAWLATLIATLKKEEQTRVFVKLWALWHARRKAIHE
jgi:hypothetical protein